MKEQAELKMVSTVKLEHAPWNPRTAEELKHDEPSMAELIASVKGTGINQSLAVWDRGDDMLVIAGNRRLEAAKAAGLSEVPAIVYTGITEARAREITRTENEIRRGVNPLMDAKLIDEMMENGLSQKEIAAHFAMSEAMVCRRRKLCGLSPAIRAAAEMKRNISTDALERIALYPEEVQERCAKSITQRVKRSDGQIKWGEIAWDFSQTMRDLDSACFNTDDCKACALRTGAQADLWGDVDTGKLGQCLKCECYEKKIREYHASVVQGIVGEGVKVVDGESVLGVSCDWLSGRDEFSKRRSKSKPVAWWFYNRYWNDEKYRIVYGPSVEEVKNIIADEERRQEANRAREKEEREAERAENDAKYERIRERQEKRRTLDEVCDRCAEVVLENCINLSEDELVKAVLESVFADREKDEAKALALVVGEWMDDCCDNTKVASLVSSVPALVKHFGVTEGAINSFKVAKAELEKFDRENND